MSPWHPLCARCPCTSRHHSTRKMHHSSPSSLASVRLAAVLRRGVGDPASAVFLGSGGSAYVPSAVGLVEVFAQAFAAQRGVRPSIFSPVREDVDCSLARVCRNLGFSGARTSSLHFACMPLRYCLARSCQSGLCSSEAAPRARRLALRLSDSLRAAGRLPLAASRLYRAARMHPVAAFSLLAALHPFWLSQCLLQRVFCLAYQLGGLSVLWRVLASAQSSAGVDGGFGAARCRAGTRLLIPEDIIRRMHTNIYTFY